MKKPTVHNVMRNANYQQDLLLLVVMLMYQTSCRLTVKPYVKIFENCIPIKF